jgi:CBS domain containing-hemolysin-like protein
MMTASIHLRVDQETAKFYANLFGVIAWVLDETDSKDVPITFILRGKFTSEQKKVLENIMDSQNISVAGVMVGSSKVNLAMEDLA